MCRGCDRIEKQRSTALRFCVDQRGCTRAMCVRACPLHSIAQRGASQCAVLSVCRCARWLAQWLAQVPLAFSLHDVTLMPPPCSGLAALRPMVPFATTPSLLRLGHPTHAAEDHGGVCACLSAVHHGTALCASGSACGIAPA